MERRIGKRTSLVVGLHMYVSQDLAQAAGDSDKTGSGWDAARVTNRSCISTAGNVLLPERDFVYPRSHLCGGDVRGAAVANYTPGGVDDCPVILTLQVQHGAYE